MTTRHAPAVDIQGVATRGKGRRVTRFLCEACGPPDEATARGLDGVVRVLLTPLGEPSGPGLISLALGETDGA
jgi:hypothetical protein